MSSQRPDKLTPVSTIDVYLALRRAWDEQVTDVALESNAQRHAILVLLAQWALETAFGKAVHWFNLGNAKHVDGDGHDFSVFRCSEVVNGREKFMDCPFVAFDSLDEGAAYYLRSLRSRFRFAWPAVLAGDVADFSRRLKAAHYYTADEPVYTAGLIRCLAQVDKEIGADTQPSPLLVDRATPLNLEAEEVGEEGPPDNAA